jgi:hypothetical protein
MNPDERDLLEACQRLGIERDHAAYKQLVGDAYELVTSDAYNRCHALITGLLERYGHVNADQLQTIKASVMDHARILLKATAVTADQGEFEAVISSETIDREKDVVDANGLVAALGRWIPSGKKIPLHWNHSSDPEDIVGWVDPASAMNTGDEVSVTGWVDRSTDRGAHVWRLIKSGVASFSFGYLITKIQQARRWWPTHHGPRPV